MHALDFLLQRPAFDLTPDQRAEFEALFSATPSGSFLDYQLPSPKWPFLSYLCDSKNLIMHGSQNIDVEEVEPRQAIADIHGHSNEKLTESPNGCPWLAALES